MPEVLDVVPVQKQDALAVEQSRFLPVMSMDVAITRRKTIAEAVKSLMVDGQDYGYINPVGKRRDGEKAFLHQPGAQKLDNLFGLVPQFEVVNSDEDWTGERHGGEPFFRYLIKCRLMRGDFLMGEAIGECNSFESKYRWRDGGRKCPDCGAAALIQTKHKSGADHGKPKNFWCAPFKGGCSAGFGLQDERITTQQTGRVPNPDIFDQVNTLVKMAQKRAHVAATINATSGSEFFTQDPEAVGGRSEDDPAPAAEESQLSVAERRIEEEKGRFKMLAAFKGVKADLNKATGSDDAYYRILGEHGVEKSDHIKNREEGEKIYKALRAAFDDAMILVTEAGGRGDANR